MALERFAEPQECLTFPLKREKLDTFAIRHPYDYVKGNIKPDAIQFFENEFVRNSMVQLRFNEHAWEHRMPCFKKNDECRAYLPTLLQTEGEIDWDTSEDIECCKSIYYDEDAKQLLSKKSKISAFTVLPERSFGDQYLNVHSTAISNIFSCNSNIQVADIGHLFYSTIYSSKSTQSEDSKNYLFISNGFASTCQYQLEKRQRACNNESSDSCEDTSDFIEGLIRVMSGIRAHMASTIVSAPMAHLLATRGSRFHLSHETKGLPVAQLEDLQEGKEISYYYRTTKKTNGSNNDGYNNDNSNDEEDVVVWPDSFADNYLMRPEVLEEVSAYEFVMKYEVVYKNTQQEDQDSESAAHETRSRKRYKGRELSFKEGHPSKGRAHVRELKHERVPIIYAKDGFIDISLLELNTSHPPSEAAIKYREQYARLALLLFYPFTNFSQLTLSNSNVENSENQESTFWCKFEDALKNNELKPDKTNSFGNIKAEDVLEHIQDRLNCQRVPKCKDYLSDITVCKEGNGSGNKKRQENNEEECDLNFSQIQSFFGDVNSENQSYSELADTDERKTDAIRRRADISDDSFVDPPRMEESSFIYNSDSHDEDNEDSNESSDNMAPVERICFSAMIQLINGVLLKDADHQSSAESSNDDRPLDLNEESLSLHAIAEEFGLTNDELQVVSFEVMCSTFILDVLNKIGSLNALDVTSNAMDDATLSSIKEVKEKLTRMGAKEQLLMFLTGAGGCGKSHVIHAARKFCHRFSQAVGVIFNANSFYLTAYLGSAAALWGGITIHSAAHMCKKKITDDLKEEWKEVRILIIDEVSYFSFNDLKTLDKKLRILRDRDKVYGGVSIVFAGDFHQLQPIGRSDPFYYNYNLLWHGAINSAVILENNHRFKDDPPFGELLGRIRQGTQTADDIELINSRFFRDLSQLPQSHEEFCYATPSNIERNSISEGMFEICIKNHPKVEDPEDPPDDVVVIEASIKSHHKLCSRKFHDFVYANCGDAQVQTYRKKKVDPALKWYPGVHLMITSNENLKEKRGNGTLCRGLKLKLKDGVNPRWKNYNGRKVLTVNVDDCEHMFCEHWLEKKEKEAGKTPKKFQLFPEEDSVVMKLPFNGQKLDIGGLKITQFGVNSNIATATGHKLQGMCQRTKSLLHLGATSSKIGFMSFCLESELWKVSTCWRN